MGTFALFYTFVKERKCFGAFHNVADKAKQLLCIWYFVMMMILLTRNSICLFFKITPNWIVLKE